MKTRFAPCFFALALVFSGTDLKAESLPPLPRTDRILTMDEVKNYWINTLRNKPIPAKPSGLHPEAQAEWQRKIDERRSITESVLRGDWDIQAKLAQLRQNADFWTDRGEEAKAEAAETKFRELLEYVARLKTLESHRQAADAAIDAAERLNNIQMEIAELRAACLRIGQ